MIRRAIDILRARGLAVLIRATAFRVSGMLASRAKSFHIYQHLFLGKSGIEIGGPSSSFTKGGIFPVYPIVQSLDNCNYSRSTVWEVDSSHENTFVFDRKKQAGRQHFVEATSMGKLNPSTYDFVLSSHMLEHTANPIAALFEWKRLLIKDGAFMLILPNKMRTFDHRRPVTTLEHLITDFKAEVAEDDLTHLPEILALHDLGRDPEAGDMTSFKSRSMRNVVNRCLHHHVFDVDLAVDLVEHIGLKVLAFEEINPHHILLLAQKTAEV